MDWNLAEAKDRFADLINLALTSGPQRVRRQQETVIVLAESEYAKLVGIRPSFKDYLMGGPSLEGIDLNRDETIPRNVPL